MILPLTEDALFDALNVKHNSTADGNPVDGDVNPAVLTCGTWQNWVYIWDDTIHDWSSDDTTDLWIAFFNNQAIDVADLAINPDTDYFT